MKKFSRRLFSLLLVLSVLASCIGGAFAAKAEDQLITNPIGTKTVTKSANGTEVIVADWVHDYTIYDAGTNGAATYMKAAAAAGLTDVYLLVKGLSGTVAWQTSVSGAKEAYSDRDILKETCDAAKPYGIRVHAWIMAARDTNYVTNVDSSSPYWHFRVGISDEVYRYVNLRDTGYQDYTKKLVKELVANYDIAGIHLDTIRYGGLYYDWGSNARNLLINSYGMTKAEYNAATQAMCVSFGYQYTTNADGYYVYSSSGTTASGSDFASVLYGGGSTDAQNGAKKFMEMRTDTVANYVKLVKDTVGSDVIVTAALMPEPCDSKDDMCAYGQSPEKIGKYADYATIMSYSCNYNAASTWPVTLSKACAKVGCNVVAGLQAYPSETGTTDPTGATIFAEYTNILDAMNEVNNSSSYTGDILGYAFFRGALMTLGGAEQTADGKVNFSITNLSDYDDTKLVITFQNGMKASAISNKSGFGSASCSLSSDGKTITISGSPALKAGGTLTFTTAVTGTVDKTLGIAKLESYTSGGARYSYCGSIYNDHTHEYTEKVTTAATCTTAGVKTFTCSCGDSYTETTPVVAHDYVPSYNASTGITTFTCSVCRDSYTSECGEKHLRVETWATSDKTHYAFCYECKYGEEAPCSFVKVEEVAATCTTPGYIKYACEGHKDSISGAHLHDTYSVDGGCGNSYTETLTASCSYIYTDNKDGTHTYACGICGDGAKTETHSYTNHVCVCGAKEEGYVTVTFFAEDGSELYATSIASGSKATFAGTVPAKAYDNNAHYVHSGWVGEKGNAVDLATVTFTADTNLFVSYTAQKHDYTYSYEAEGTTHTGKCSCGYSIVEDHNFVGGVCVCGNLSSADIDPNLSIYTKSLNLQSYIGANYIVKTSCVADYDRYYLGVKIGDRDEIILEAKSLTSALSYFEVKTAAAQMTETLTAVLYAEKDGVVYHSAPDVWSTRTGLMDQVNGIKDLTNADNRKKMTLMVDLLNYGAAAQVQFNQRIDDLANSLLTAEQKGYGTSTNPVISASSRQVSTGCSDVTFAVQTIALESSIQLQFLLNNPSRDTKNLAAQVVCGDSSTYVYLEDYSGNYDMLRVEIPGAQLRDEIRIVIFDFSTAEKVSSYLYCSAEALAANTSASQRNVINAMLRYGDSAAAYFGS